MTMEETIMMLENLNRKSVRSFVALVLAAVFAFCILPPSTAAAIAAGAWNLITDPSTSYSRIYDMVDGKFFMVTGENGLYGLMNADLEYVVEPQYAAINSYSDFMVGCKNQLWCIMDANGNQVTAPIYNSLRINDECTDGIIIYGFNGKYGLIRIDGTVLTAPTYEHINHAADNVFICQVNVADEEQIYFSDTQVTSAIYQNIEYLGDGYCVANLLGNDNVAVIISKTGEVINVSPGYTNAEYLGNDYFLINDSKRVTWREYNKAAIQYKDQLKKELGTVVANDPYEFENSWNDGYVIEKSEDKSYAIFHRDIVMMVMNNCNQIRYIGDDAFLFENTNGLYGVIEADGDAKLNAEYTEASIQTLKHSNKKYCIVKKDGKYGLISSQGVSIPCEYDSVSIAYGKDGKSECCIVGNGQKWGCYEISQFPAKLDVPVSYKSVRPLGDGYYAVVDGSMKHGIMKDGQFIKAPQYDSVYYCGNNGFIGSSGGKYGAFVIGGSIDTGCIYDDIVCSFMGLEAHNSRWHAPSGSQAIFVFPESIPAGTPGDSGDDDNGGSGSNNNQGSGGSSGGSSGGNSGGSSGGNVTIINNFGISSGEGIKLKVNINGKETEVLLTLSNFTYTYDVPVQATTVCAYNLRKGPDASYGTAKKVKKGAEITIIGRDRDWLVVDMGGGKVAYIPEGMVQ